MRDFMTVGDLIALLSDFDPTRPVRLMTQPSWPFEYSIGGVADAADFGGGDDDDDDDAGDRPARRSFQGDKLPDSDQPVYLVEGQQLAYGDRSAWDVARRG